MYMKHTHTQSVGTGREYNLDGVIGKTVGVGHGGGWVWGEGVHVLMWHSMPSSEVGRLCIYRNTHSIWQPLSTTAWLGPNVKPVSTWLQHEIVEVAVVSGAALQSNQHQRHTDAQFLQARRPSCHPPCSVKAVKADLPKTDWGQKSPVVISLLREVSFVLQTKWLRENLYFSTSMDWELHSFLTVAMEENLKLLCTRHTHVLIVAAENIFKLQLLLERKMFNRSFEFCHCLNTSFAVFLWCFDTVGWSVEISHKHSRKVLWKTYRNLA